MIASQTLGCFWFYGYPMRKAEDGLRLI
jgi:hypothetical protein